MLCCGCTRDGQLGLGASETEIYSEFVANKNLQNMCKQIAPGVSHTLFLMTDGSVYSCGCNDFEQLGHKKQNRKPQLIDALNTQDNQQVSVGLHFSVVLSTNGHVFIFGSLSGDQSKQDKLYFSKPIRVKGFSSTKILQIASGYHHLLAMGSDGVIFSMGLNEFGQLGTGNKDTAYTPTKLASFQGIPPYQISCGGYHSILISISGSVFTFGSNSFGQLGVSGTVQIYPQHVKQLHGQRSRFATCGENHTAIITSDGGVFTYGAGMYGQLGHSSINHESLPRKVFELMGICVTQIACGRYHTVALVPSTGRFYAFGLATNGQLGIKNQDNVKMPTVVQGVWGNSTAGKDRRHITKHSNGSSSVGIYSIFAGGDSTFIRLNSTGKSPLDYRNLSPNMQISKLTFEICRELVNITAKKESHISADDARIIDILFGSETCLNASFLREHDQHMNTSLRNHGIDLKQVIDSFEKLRSMNTVVETMVVDNMSKMLLSLPRYPAGLEALRVYIILPFCHIFENMKYLDNIINRFTNAVNLLSPFASNVIDQWYDQGHTTFFDRALQIFKPLVMYILRLPQSSDQDEIYKYRMMLRSTLDFLGRLHRICNSSSNEIASYDAFYIPELSQIIDVQYDYLEWIGRGGTLQPSGPITFCDYPFVFDGVAKCRLLQIDARLKRQVACNNAVDSNFAHAFGFGGSPELPVLRLLISRNRILHDTIDQLKYCVPEDLKKPLKVTFIGEEGVDAGGVKKEFFLLLMRELLDPKYGMFIHYDDTHCIWFNEFSFEEDDMYNLVGKICALAIYNEIIIDLPFPPVLYKKLLNDARLTLEDLKDLSATTYRGFKEMLNYTKNDFQDVFCLTMSVEKDAFGKITTVDLINNGRNIPVTLENANEYVQAYIEHLFNASVEQQFRQFYNGFHQVMSSAILRMFQPAELMTMIVGTRNYDFDLIQKYVRYEGVFYADHQVIKWFWDVIREFSSKEKKLFLVFLTGTDRFPMVGLNTFRIIIHPTYGGDEYFPVAHTCFNRLDLPVYSSKAILKAKLSEAIQHDKGFTLA